MGQSALSSKFAEHTKVGGMTGAADGCATLRGTLTGEMQNRAKRNLMKLSKGNCTVLYLGRSSPVHQCALGTAHLAGSFAEKFLGVLLDTKVRLSKQCWLTAKMANSMLGSI